jgi:hypothetical protein
MVDIDAGVCGFRTRVNASSEDAQHVRLEIGTDCEKIKDLSRRISECGEVDAYQEISPARESVILAAARSTLKGCCAGCAVPVGIFKGLQVAAGLALPRNLSIEIATED